MLKLLPFAILLGLMACAVQKNWTPTGGSRADGVIRLSYEYGPFETPQTSAAQGQRLAAQRCQAWGYDHAEAFGGQTRNCSAPDGFGGCNTWLVTMEYQCLGSLEQ